MFVAHISTRQLLFCKGLASLILFKFKVDNGIAYLIDF
jgi:hypothetical protein